jgi:D-aspartate ligase
MITDKSVGPKSKFGAVVLGLSPTGLHVLRELGAAEVPLIGVTSSIEPGLYSKYLKNSVTVLAKGGSDRLCEDLLKMADRSDRRWVLIPTSDSYIEFIVQYRKVLARSFRFQASYNPELYEAIVDKRAFAELCRVHDVDSPQCWIRESSELEELLGGIEFPILLKPAFIHVARSQMRGRKVLVARDRQEYRKAVSEARSFGGRWLIQEVIPGPESEITLFSAYFDSKQRAHQAFTARKLRQYPPGFGSASLVLSQRLEETKHLSIELFRALKYEGIASAEFKRDPRDDRLKIIEINPRPSLWFAAAHHAGRRISLACFCDLVGMELPEEENQQAENVLWRYFWKDMYSAAFYRMKGKEFVLGGPQVTANFIGGGMRRVGPVFEAKDWHPVIGEGFRYMSQGLSRIFGKRKC